MMLRPVNHIAISVTDIDRAVKWYTKIFGFTVLAGPLEISIEGSDTHIAKVVTTVFGNRMKKFLICHMASANGVGIEIFQFVEPQAQLKEDNFEYWKSGFFHICMTDPDIEDLVNRIVENGGKRRTEIMELFIGTGKRICFCEDPFGNIIEIYSHSYEQTWTNLPTE